MGYTIQKVNEYYYIIKQWRENGVLKRKYMRRATQDEMDTYVELKEKNKNLISVSCSYPECDNVRLMTRAQKHEFFTTYPMRYGTLHLPYCSKSCQEKHFKELQSEKSKIKVK
jgi:hypothetical protein